ncbi:RecF/RecN/SMC [Corchorus capsularis]|uniref:Structural maintenance of chromosomes protein n=1 Tax=Corchorus capsularis TaxID=210143 RepID=A0A1R3J8C0_COCAP|nr:RecF/RecN/SMC [Corchorus capsularis]
MDLGNQTFSMHLQPEHRHALLHEGAGHQVLSAFVEIVFDNFDNRIPVDKEEVRLRRTIGFKKDDYYLDGKHITKTEVMNLLESAGFSRSNPYYVVQQGKIASLTLMKDSERLDLLKEIGGTRVYEERRRESLKIMQETGNKRKQIIQVVQYLDERLKELDEEKEELRKYQQLDKQRKALEYTIYDKELQDARHKLEEVEEQRTKISEESAGMYNAVLDSHERFKEIEKMSKDLTKELQSLNKDKEALEMQQAKALKKQTALELDVKDLEEKMSGNMQARDDAVKQLRLLEKEIQDSTEERNQIKPKYDSQVKQEETITKGIMEREKQLSILYQKQGRATQFSSKAARDRWLDKEISDLKRVLQSNLIQIAANYYCIFQEQKLQEEIGRLHKDLEEQDASIEIHKTEIIELESSISQSRISSQKAERDKLQEERKSLWDKESKISAEIDKLKAELEKAEKSLDHATPGDVRRGLNSVRRICKEYKYGGVFGPIIELLSCDDKFFTSVEVTAGNSLFHVVVESDDVSTKIIRHLNSMKGGRVTFIPLNRVKAPHVTYPQSSDVIPLLRKLNFSPKFAPAFAQVFGRTVICRDIDVATRVARTDGLDCITLEGDQVSKKGGMTGGYYDPRRSRLKFMNIITQNSLAREEKEQELNRLTVTSSSVSGIWEKNLLDIEFSAISFLKLRNLPLVREIEVEHRTTLVDVKGSSRLEQKITALVTEQQQLDAKRVLDKSLLEQHKLDIANFNKQKQHISKALENKEKSLADVRTQIDQLKASMAMKEAEMGTELIDHLTPEEKDLLSRLNPEIADLKEQLIKCRSDRFEIETRKAELETNLTTNLKRRKQELEGMISAAEADASLDEADMKRQELRDAKLLVEDATQQLKRVCDAIDERTKQLKELKDEKNKLKDLEDNYERRLQDDAKGLEQLLSKRSNLLAKQEEYSKKIRELGPLSSDAFETYKRKHVKELLKMLHKCNEQLQKFSHVNKKALDQYINFTEQREELQRRQAELDAGDEKIKELIAVLDQRKDESIERTFKGVARHFREVFSELVQGGHGHLVMMKKKDGDHAADDDQDDDEPREADAEGRVEKYIGVKVKVSFTGQGETQSMKQLSGGQKTVVALTLIFAIQRCDPAPFYLFDEIDAALDPQYRTAVGNMIRRLADMANTQFITTTFRPELVKVADKIYGVTHRNKVSTVGVISRDAAFDFIEKDQSHNAD